MVAEVKLPKKNIPVRTFADWNEDKPGFMVGDCPTIMEIDLVAHCGESASGQFLNTLTCTDICTGWTEPIGLRRRSQETVCFAIDAMQKELPFDLLGIDSDNGSLQATIMVVNSHLHTCPAKCAGCAQVQVSMTCSIGIVWTKRSPSHVPVHTRKTTRRMPAQVQAEKLVHCTAHHWL